MGAVVAFLLAAAGAALLVLLIKTLYLDRRFAKNIPTVQPVVPILGHAPYFVGKSTEQVFQVLIDLFSRVDRMAKSFIAHKMIVLVNHPDLVQQLLNRTDLYDKPFFYDLLNLGSGLISQRSGAEWKRARRLLNPTFNTRILTGFLPIMDDCGKDLVKQLEPLADGTTDVDMLKHTGQTTLEMICRTTMNCKMDGRSGFREFLNNLDFIFAAVGRRILNVSQYVDFIYRMTKTYRRVVTCTKICNDFTEKVISKRRLEIEKDNEGPRSNFLIFVDQLLTINHEDGSGLSDNDIREQIYTMIIAGQETTALAVSYACLFVAKHPEWQQKLVSEIREVFPDCSCLADSDALKRLDEMDVFLKELLRLIPVGPIIARESATSFELDGVKFPPGQIIAMNFYTLHRRKDVWGETADQFDPERFRPEQARDRHPYAYLPFSGGQRNCIGARYAMNSIKIMLVRILQNFEIKTKLRLEDLRFRYEISLKLEGPHAVQLVRRDLYS